MASFESLFATVFVMFGLFAIGSYGIINSWYLILHVLALFELRDDVRESSWKPPFRKFASPFYPGIGIIVPAYNEEATIVESLRSMLSLNYPELEIVVVNDGSTDSTLDRLIENFDLETVDADIPFEVPAAEIHDVYRSTTYEELLVVDKNNGGKSDALNAGLWLTEMSLFCAVDSDTLIDREALLSLVRPFLNEPTTNIASGGVIRVANECRIEDGVVKDVRLPKTGLPGLQVMEYLRAFYSGRLGLNRLNGLILISGAFGLFKTDVVREIGGYRHDTVTEDFDIIVRLHRHLKDQGRKYTVDFVPEPVAWTEVPSTRRGLSRQRRRWYRGMVETVVTHWRMLFNPKYGRVGMVILPFFVVAETIGRLLEGLGYVLLPLAWYFGLLSLDFFIIFFLLTTGFGIFLSWFSVFSEVSSFNRYDSPWQILRLLFYGVLENFGYRQWKALIAWRGLFEYLTGVETWGVMERTGFSTEDGAEEGTETETEETLIQSVDIESLSSQGATFTATRLSEEELASLSERVGDGPPRAVVDVQVQSETELQRPESTDETTRVTVDGETVTLNDLVFTQVGVQTRLSGERSNVRSIQAISERATRGVTIEVPEEYRDRSIPIRLRVDQDHFDEMTPANASLGHLNETQGWELLETCVIEETNESVVLETRTHGFSTFAVFLGPRVQYHWSLPNGSTRSGSDRTVEYAFEEPGVHEVSLTVTDGLDRQDSTELQVLANDVPQADIVVENTTASGNVTLAADIDNEVGNVTATWTFPDGTEVVGQRVTRQLGTGDHDIRLRVEDEFGASSQTRESVPVSPQSFVSETRETLGIGRVDLRQLMLALLAVVVVIFVSRRVIRGTLIGDDERELRITELRGPFVEHDANRFGVEVLTVRDPASDLESITFELFGSDGEVVARERIDIAADSHYTPKNEGFVIEPCRNIPRSDNFRIHVRVATSGDRYAEKVI
jgi:cellulose synthase/poly-beta-1,6-N-acetylglucosamine synthase-like glycosyltransferase